MAINAKILWLQHIHTQWVFGQCEAMQSVVLIQAGCCAGAVVLLSAYFAGTTLGIFTLDRVGLQILSQASDDAVERAHASMRTSHANSNSGDTSSCTDEALLKAKVLIPVCLRRDHTAC